MDRRLRMLEQHQSGGRCPTCRDWETHYVEFPPGYYEARSEWDRANNPEPKQHPGQCAGCGFEPVLIAVKYVEWGKTTNAGPHLWLHLRAADHAEYQAEEAEEAYTGHDD